MLKVTIHLIFLFKIFPKFDLPELMQLDPETSCYNFKKTALISKRRWLS